MSDERIPATNPELLRRLRNWDDAPAWIEFVQSYEATILRWCRALRLGPEAEDEVAARVLTRLVFRMQTFRYDPSRSFRAWLWVLVRRVALSYHRERGASAVTLDFEPVALPDSGESPSEEHPLLAQAREVQEKVRQAGDERSWQIFVRCDVNGEPTAEVARSLQMSYHAVYVARKRVRARLAREGARLRRVPAPVCDPDEPEDAP